MPVLITRGTLFKIAWKNYTLKGPSSEILILFLAFMERPCPEHEPLPVFEFFCGFLDFGSYIAFSAQFIRFHLGKILFFETFSK
jgi:hypothetical protein